MRQWHPQYDLMEASETILKMLREQDSAVFDPNTPERMDFALCIERVRERYDRESFCAACGMVLESIRVDEWYDIRCENDHDAVEHGVIVGPGVESADFPPQMPIQ